MMTDREWNSEAYNRLSDPQFGWGLKVLERVAALPPRGGERVMDAGCGTGRVTAELMKLFPHGSAVAVDLSVNMLAQARLNLVPLGDRVIFVDADLQQLPFSSAFDGIFSTAVFHWTKNHPRLFASIAQALRPGGWLIAQCGGKGNLDHVRRRVRETQAKPAYAEYFLDWQEPWEYADDRTTAERLRAAGFTKVNTWLEDAAFSIDDAAQYRDFIKTVIVRVNLQQMPNPLLQEQFVDDLTEQARHDGFVLDYRRLNIDARRSSS